MSAGHRDEAEQLSVLMNMNPGEAVRTAFANLSQDGTAKIFFTSAGVDILYADPVPAGVVVAERTS